MRSLWPHEGDALARERHGSARKWHHTSHRDNEEHLAAQPFDISRWWTLGRSRWRALHRSGWRSVDRSRWRPLNWSWRWPLYQLRRWALDQLRRWAVSRSQWRALHRFRWQLRGEPATDGCTDSTSASAR